MNINKTKTIALIGLLFALAIIFSAIENALPPIPFFVPGIKFGLSNIIVMFALFFVGKRQAFAIAVLKAIFVFSTRGAVAGLLSLSGGIFSVVIMVILLLIFKEKISYLLISTFGAIFHNIGQFIAVSLIYTSMGLIAYLPLLLIAGVIAGIVTATLLKFVLPAFKKLKLIA